MIRLVHSNPRVPVYQAIDVDVFQVEFKLKKSPHLTQINQINTWGSLKSFTGTALPE